MRVVSLALASLVALTLSAAGQARRGDVVFFQTIAASQYLVVKGPDLDSRRLYRLKVTGTASLKIGAKDGYDALYCFKGCSPPLRDPMLVFNGDALDEWGGVSGRVPYNAFHEYTVERTGDDSTMRIAVIEDTYGLSDNTGGWTVTIMDVGPAGAKPKPSGSTALRNIETLPEYRVFYGLDDPPIPPATWVGRLAQRATDLVSRARTFPGVTRDAVIPGEQRTGKHSPRILNKKSDLRVLLQNSDPPKELVAAGNVYAAATRAAEAQLRAAILASEGSLAPADVLYYALKATNGSYPLAVLTAHNLLKNVTVVGREAVAQSRKERKDAPKVYAKNQDRYEAELRDSAAVAAKLASLRRTPPGGADKMGPWYHVFAVLTAGAVENPLWAQAVVLGEHGGKLGNLFRSEGGFNAEKFAIDQAFAAMAPALAGISRTFL